MPLVKRQYIRCLGSQAFVVAFNNFQAGIQQLHHVLAPHPSNDNIAACLHSSGPGPPAGGGGTVVNWVQHIDTCSTLSNAQVTCCAGSRYKHSQYKHSRYKHEAEIMIMIPHLASTLVDRGPDLEHGVLEHTCIAR